VILVIAGASVGTLRRIGLGPLARSGAIGARVFRASLLRWTLLFSLKSLSRFIRGGFRGFWQFGRKIGHGTIFGRKRLGYGHNWGGSRFGARSIRQFGHGRLGGFGLSLFYRSRHKSIM
jgi:hypothetical protein